MADIYGVNYEKEWVLDPSEQAAKGTRNAHLKCQLEEASGISAGDDVYLCKIQADAILVEVSEIAGAALGAGGLKVKDKDGNETVVVAGDSINGQVDGGLDLILVADGATAASLKVLVKLLMD